MPIPLADIPTISIFSVLSTLESAHEPDQIAAAERKIADWGHTRATLEAEFDRREREKNRWNISAKFVVDTRNRHQA